MWDNWAPGPQKLETTIDQIVSAALAIVQKCDHELLSALDRIAAPLYVTDADGVITYFNPACIGFAGRTPVAVRHLEIVHQ